MRRRNRIMRRGAAALALATAALGAAATAPGTATAARGGPAAIKANDNRVGPSQRVTLTGRLRVPVRTDAPASGSGPAKGKPQPVRIEFRRLGSQRWRKAGRDRTGRSGRFRTRVVVRRSGRYRARGGDGRTTAGELVIVRSKLRARLGNDDPKLGEKVTVRGRVRPGNAGRPITVAVGGRKLRTRTHGNGRFKLRYKPSRAGRRTVRVRARGDRVATGSADRAGRVRTFRPAGASYYGPGLYGNGVACGGTLRPDTIGVAHKSLPCGTKLTIRYGHRTVKNVKVIDRGPYVAGRELDLTAALRNKLGFGGVGTVWVDR